MKISKRFVLPAFLSVAGAENIRRLIIDGQFDSLKDHPHAVALMICTPPSSGNPNYVCGIHCSGSLIAPNVVVSAGHCVRDPTPVRDDNEMSINYDNFFVLAGSTDYDVEDWSEKSKIVKVKRAIHGGIGTNVRFPMDGDISVLELEDCIDPIAGQIEFAKIATRSTEPANDNCAQIAVSGFGQISNAPDAIRDDDGKRRVSPDTIQSFPVCRDAFLAAVYGWKTPNQGTPSSQDYETVVPEIFLCMGGSTLRSVCFGDSGGGYVVPVSKSDSSLGNQVVGVVSFGIGDYCTTSPDYASRLSFRASWINDQLNTFTSCPSWSWQKSFASWPVTSWDSSVISKDYSSTRCHDSSWQCMDGSACIDKSKVCDGYWDCTDGSDEDSSYCAPPNQVNMGVLKSSREPSGLSYLEAEFYDLLNRKADKIRDAISSSNLDVPIRGIDPKVNAPRVIVAGVISATGKKVRPIPKSANSVVDPKSLTWPVSYKGKRSDCGSALSTYEAALQDAKNQDTRDDHWDPVRLEDACIDLGVCSGDTSSSSFSDAEIVCSSLSTFLEWNATVTDYSDNFNTRFNAACLDPNSDPDAESTTKSTHKNVLSHFILLGLSSIAIFASI